MRRNQPFKLIYLPLDDVGSCFATYQVTTSDTTFSVFAPTANKGKFNGDMIEAELSLTPQPGKLLAFNAISEAVENAEHKRLIKVSREHSVLSDQSNAKKVAILNQSNSRLTTLIRIGEFHKRLLDAPLQSIKGSRYVKAIFYNDDGTPITFEDMIEPVIQTLKKTNNTPSMRIIMPEIIASYTRQGINPHKAVLLRNYLRTELTGLRNATCEPSDDGRVGEGTIVLNKEAISEFTQKVISFRQKYPMVYHYEDNLLDSPTMIHD